MLGRFAFAMTFANLLLNFLGNTINGDIKIVLLVDSEKIGAAHSQADGTRKLFFRKTGVVMFQGHPRINCPLVEMFQLIKPVKNMIFNGFGQRHIVGG